MASNATTSSDAAAAEKHFEIVSFDAIFVGIFFWGVHATLFVFTAYNFFEHRHKRRTPLVPVTYVFLLFASATVYMVCAAKWAVELLVSNIGGPQQYYLDHFNHCEALVGTCFFIITNFLADSLLIRSCSLRLSIVWGCRWTIVVFPILVFCGSTVMSILTVYQLAQPGAHFFSDIGLQMTLPYFSLSIALNIILTAMIVTRLVMARRSLKEIQDEEQARIYTGVVAMIVESASLYSTFSVVFIATYSVNNVAFNVCLPLQVQLMCISPLLIMIRVARGHAFSQKAVSKLESGDFMSATRAADTYNMTVWPSKENDTQVVTISKEQVVV
ncbi:hypothetical protein AURDEDRAFT_136532 [Auricularia subglabra TFB-10046 SS5]|nr:hypothetical protein AURDEDRAFT_136532 [Auricularia subglabra TFB-10046 SS5]